MLSFLYGYKYSGPGDQLFVRDSATGDLLNSAPLVECSGYGIYVDNNYLYITDTYTHYNVRKYNKTSLAFIEQTSADFSYTVGLYDLVGDSTHLYTIGSVSGSDSVLIKIAKADMSITATNTAVGTPYKKLMYAGNFMCLVGTTIYAIGYSTDYNTMDTIYTFNTQTLLPGTSYFYNGHDIQNICTDGENIYCVDNFNNSNSFSKITLNDMQIYNVPNNLGGITCLSVNTTKLFFTASNSLYSLFKNDYYNDILPFQYTGDNFYSLFAENTSVILPTYKVIECIADPGSTVYTMVRQDDTNKYLDNGDDDKYGIFEATPDVPYTHLIEDSVFKGTYKINDNRSVWEDGYYTIAVYVQDGELPSPAYDKVVYLKRVYVKDDIKYDSDVDIPKAVLDTGNKFANGKVYINSYSSITGTNYPNGEATFPVNNWEDAKEIATANNIFTIEADYVQVDSSFEIDSGYIYLTGGDRTYNNYLEIGENCNNASASHFEVEGYGTFSDLTDCEIGSLNSPISCSFMQNCTINASVAIDTARMFNCKVSSLFEGEDREFDLATCSNLQVSGLSGAVKLVNSVASTHLTMNLQGCTVEIDSTCAEPILKWIFTGIGKVINTAGITNIQDDTINNSVEIPPMEMSPETIASLAGTISDSIEIPTIEIPLETLKTLAFSGGNVYVRPLEFAIDDWEVPTGVTFPVGTSLTPANNLADAVSIATTNKLKTIKITATGITEFTHREPALIGTDPVLTGYIFEGNDATSSFFVINGRFNGVKGIYCKNLNLNFTFTGSYYGGINSASYCYISSLTRCEINAYHSYIKEIKILNTPYFESCTFVDTSVLDYVSATMGESPEGITALNCNGNVIIQNMTHSSNFAILSMSSGSITIDESCVAGTISISGVCTVIDNSEGTTVSISTIQQGITDISSDTLLRTDNRLPVQGVLVTTADLENIAIGEPIGQDYSGGNTIWVEPEEPSPLPSNTI